MRTYYAFTDPAGGSGSDSMTMAIAHRSMLKDAVLDGFWERKPPFSPDDVVREFAAILESYRVTVVVGDRYAGAWVAERFREHHITYQPSERTKSEIYIELVALLNSHRVRIPRDRRLRQQFASLERRASRTGKSIVDHGLSGHDDVCNSVAGALTLASRVAQTLDLSSFNVFLPLGGAPPADAAAPSEEERLLREREWERGCFDMRRSSLLR
jgi:hypothetical protein